MGCFLACFGFTKKRKRRKNSSSNRRRRQIIYEDQSYGRYVPLDSDVVTVKLDIVEMQNQNQNQNASATKLSDKPKESSTSKIKKKVRFNLNVKSYEPLTTNDDYDEYLSHGEEKKKTVWELNGEERSGTTTTTTRLEFEEEYHHPNASLKKIGGSCSSYPANYRYQNCRNSYSEEEDEIEIDDTNFDSNDNDDDNYDSDGENDSNNNVNSGSMKSEKAAISSTAGLGELGKCKIDQLRDSSSVDQSISVLNPVENLTQWKAIKAKSKQQQIKQQKENNIVVLQQEQNLPLLKHISKSSSGSDRKTVDASLSKWLF